MGNVKIVQLVYASREQESAQCGILASSAKREYQTTKSTHKQLYIIVAYSRGLCKSNQAVIKHFMHTHIYITVQLITNNRQPVYLIKYILYMMT